MARWPYQSQWSIPLDKLIEKASADVDTAARAIAMEAFSRVMLRTPVDTGRLRSNWIPSSGSPEEGREDGETTDESMRAAVLSYPVGPGMYLTNSLPYAETVEYGLYPNPPKGGAGKTSGGYSTQAPAGMVRVTVAEINSIVAEAVKK